MNSLLSVLSEFLDGARFRLGHVAACALALILTAALIASMGWPDWTAAPIWGLAATAAVAFMSRPKPARGPASFQPMLRLSAVMLYLGAGATLLVILAHGLRGDGLLPGQMPALWISGAITASALVRIAMITFRDAG